MAEQLQIKEISADIYAAFLEKFDAPKTTDDCYTPPLVYDAVADWVSQEYGISRENMVRPFYPGGDFESERYDETDVVVDNPPFSILSKIIGFYAERNVRFFLFSPALTLFASSSASSCAVAVGARIVYANGAIVPTSFLTNLENLRFRTAPELFQKIKGAVERTKAQTSAPPLPKYKYPDYVVTSAMLNYMTAHGVNYSASVEETEFIGKLDAQRALKKSIFGNGYLLSEKATAEKAAAEKAAAEKAAAIPFELSDRERAIVARLSGKEPPQPAETCDENQITIF